LRVFRKCLSLKKFRRRRVGDGLYFPRKMFNNCACGMQILKGCIMKTAPAEKRHLVLTANGLAGACAAAAVLLRYPEARIQFTSPRHIPKALELLRGEKYAGKVHICGIGISPPTDDLDEILRGLADNMSLIWYGGADHPELQSHAEHFGRRVKFLLSAASTTIAAIIDALDVRESARALLLTELAEEVVQNRTPRSELHRFCHDAVQAANRRFFFFGDDALNEKVIRYLAGVKEKTRELDEAVEAYRSSPDALYPLGSSRAMKGLREQIGRLGAVPEPVLVTGPTGSGKELMAKALHITSGRSGAFIAVNCAVLGGNPALVEDRLFGHVKGAYTSAHTETKGAFEEAHGGTLFLDEVGELPAEAQAQLLRVLEDREVRPVGTMKTRPVDVRVIAATHRNLSRMVAEGTFRQDLFYRLNVLMIRVPPLRERPEDMKSIAAHVATGLKTQGYELKLAKTDWDAIRAFEWPGNVRQFLNVLKRAAYLKQPLSDLLEDERTSEEESETVDRTSLLRLYIPETPDDVTPAQEIYHLYVKHVLHLFDGNIMRTAKALRIAPNTLRKYIGRDAGANPEQEGRKAG
jgi:DNA-binding NtrC family response regulator